ncbi:Putative RNA polymerase II subunit B1 CTD phosphatase RPAP2 (RNA polymerase II-associated protein 2) [Durusdinium trenchii]|uniref:RNA polymerase II subunit B1 CTD phosphatase RPAP2 homolog n=1 Tax=Durusdinium trenchii TaxID=1381693 RepID=A0ABP0JQ48_9DINO
MAGGAPCAGNPVRRAAEEARRQKITEELAARKQNSKELWALQQELLKKSVKTPLLEAARQLFQAEHYDAVVEERSLEELCGYPLCGHRTTALPAEKRWAVNYATREVMDAEEVKKFCGPSCRRESQRFRASLQPEPIYLRPASALTAAQTATATAEQTATAQKAEDSRRDEKEAKDKDIPAVRPRTVVRFSREKRSYQVHYSEYAPRTVHREGDDLYDPEVVPDGKCSTPWIQAWATLNTWITETAKEVLRGAQLELAEDRRPAHKGRRDLLLELLTSRLPGEFSFLASRFYELVSSLGVHQALPSITERALYDLLAAVLLRGLYLSDAQRGLYVRDEVQVELLEQRMKEAAQCYGIAEEELKMMTQLTDLYKAQDD